MPKMLKTNPIGPGAQRRNKEQRGRDESSSAKQRGKQQSKGAEQTESKGRGPRSRERQGIGHTGD